MSCSGWGHVTTCYRNGKTKSKLGCPTQDLIDIIYKLKLFDRVAYTRLLAEESPAVNYRLNKIEYGAEFGWVNPGNKRRRLDTDLE